MSVPTLVGMTSINAADSTTGWSGWGQNSAKWGLEADIIKEGSGSIGLAPFQTGDGGYGYQTGSTLDVSSNLIAIWLYSTPNFCQDISATPAGIYVRITDSTSSWTTTYDDYYVGGNDVAWVGRGWHLIVLDCNRTRDRGSGTVTLANVRRIGVGINVSATASKSTIFAIDAMYSGNTVEVTGPQFTDGTNGIDFNENGASADTIVRQDGGSFVTDGWEVGDLVLVATPSDDVNGVFQIDGVTASTLTIPIGSFVADYLDDTVGYVHCSVTFEDVYQKDGPTDDNWWGVIDKDPGGTYIINYPMTIGEASGTDGVFFLSTGEAVVAADQPLDTTREDYIISDEATAITIVAFGGYGFLGSTFIGQASVLGSYSGKTPRGMDFPNLTFGAHSIERCSFLDFDGGIDFPSTARPDGTMDTCTFANCGAIQAFEGTMTNMTFFACGQVTSQGGDMTGAEFTGYEGTADTAYLVWFDATDTDGNLDDAIFQMGAALTHAIEFEAPGSYTFNDLVFTDYNASDEQNDSALYNAISPTTVDSYSESNQDSDGNIGAGAAVQEFGQEFLATAGDLSSARFYLKKTGTPTGTAVARLYASDGGSPAEPTGAALAESETLDVSTLTGSYVLTQLNFSDEYTMTATDYFVALEYNGGDGSNYIQAGYDGSAPSHGGNAAARTFGGSWTGFSGQDVCFYVYRDGHVVVSISSGATPSTKTVNVGAHITVQNTKTLEITGVTEGARVVIQNSSDGSEYLNALAFTSDGQGGFKATASFPYVSDTAVRVGAASSGKVVAGMAEDSGVYTDETIQANDSGTAAGETMTLIPTASPASPDGFNYGHTEKFTQMDMDVLTAGVGTYTVEVAFYNGSGWTAVSGLSDGTNGYKNAGVNRISWSDPGGSWQATTLSNQPGATALYYIRIRYVSGTVTTTPVGRTAHLDVTRYRRWEDEATIVSTGLSIKATWIEDTIAIF